MIYNISKIKERTHKAYENEILGKICPLTPYIMKSQS